MSRSAANPFAGRLEAFVDHLAARRLEAAVVYDPINLRALTGVECDAARLWIDLRGRKARLSLATDFRYVPALRRTAPWLQLTDIRSPPRGAATVRSLGYEDSLSVRQFAAVRKFAPLARRRVEVGGEIRRLRAVKTPAEIAILREAERRTLRVFEEESAAFRPGMTEREMARRIKARFLEEGEGEAFATIVSIGRNAAECHHVPDDTVWNGREPILVDMGLKYRGYAADLTRNVLPARPSRLYRQVYGLVEAANRAAIAAARPGMTGRELDAVARRIIRRGGFGQAFGHALGHGVGLEIHELPTASTRSGELKLEPGMLVTIEPGIYLEGNLGVRIEDLILITETGAEVLSE